MPSHQDFGEFAIEVKKILQATPPEFRWETGMCATAIYVQQQQQYYTIRVLVVRTPVSSLSFQVQHTWYIISGRVDMLTSPVPAARAAVATGAWVESKHDMCLIHKWKCGSLALFLPIRRRMKKEKRRSLPGTWCSACKHPIDYYTNQRYGRLSCA